MHEKNRELLETNYRTSQMNNEFTLGPEDDTFGGGKQFYSKTMSLAGMLKQYNTTAAVSLTKEERGKKKTARRSDELKNLDNIVVERT